MHDLIFYHAFCLIFFYIFELFSLMLSFYMVYWANMKAKATYFLGSKYDF
jgi:hypothetical protein